jgi:dephospho-CoA kinase
MLVIGLTGSIGMGKSAVAAMLRERGIAVFDADAEVHRLYEGPAVAAIEKAFPGSSENGRVNRHLLARRLVGDPEKFKALEAIVHPLVERAEREFLKAEAARGAKLAVLEIPLLFETARDRMVDVTLVVSAPPDVQRKRVLERPSMTAEKLEQLLLRQMSDEEKRRRADYVVDTGGSLVETEAQLAHIIDGLMHREGKAFKRHWL